MNHKHDDQTDPRSDPQASSSDQRPPLHRTSSYLPPTLGGTRSPDSWFTRLVYAVLFTGIATLGITRLSLPAYARLSPHHQEITESVEEAGYTLDTKGPYCKEPYTMAYVNHPKKRFVLCASNLTSNDLTEKAIRHEAIHVAQACNDHNPISGPLATILAYQAQSVRYGLDPRAYQPEELPYEGEAFVLSVLLTPQEINAIVRTHCNLN